MTAMFGTDLGRRTETRAPGQPGPGAPRADAETERYQRTSRPYGRPLSPIARRAIRNATR
jgi:hypothetical protein